MKTNKLTLDQIKSGEVARISPRSLSALAGCAYGTVLRKIKAGLIAAVIDEAGRVFVPAEAALRFLSGGKEYSWNPGNQDAILRMERARSGKKFDA